MDKLKQNAFWAGVLIAGAALVIAFGALVVPLWAKKAGLQNKVKGVWNNLKKEKTFPSDGDIETHKKQRGEIIKAYAEFGIFYGQSSEHLQRWFPDLKLAVNAVPNRGNFMASYRLEKDKVEQALKAGGVKIGIGEETVKFGFNWEDPEPAQFVAVGADDTKVLKEIQKRFWARERVAKAIQTILAEGGKVNRVHDFRFFRKLHPQMTGPWDAFPSAQDAVNYMAVGVTQAYMAPQNFQEYELPQKLGRTITFGFALELPYSQVPRVISEILNPAAEKGVANRLLVNVIGSHVSIREQNQPSEPVVYTVGDEAARTAAIQKVKDAIKPIEVILTVTCQIIDFEPSELKKFEPAQE
jgi:hypothetical protein